MPLEEFSAAVERLYAAAADPALWGDALRAVENLTGSAGAVIGFVPKRGGTGFVLSGRFSTEQCQEYARDYAPACPRLAFAARRSDIPLHYDRLLMSEAEMDRDPVYQWFERVSGVRYYVGSTLPEIGDFRVDASLQRTRTQGHVQRADLELFSALKPHIARALHLSKFVDTLAGQRPVALHVLEALPHGAVLLDASGRVLFANGVAADIFAANDGLVASGGQLVAARSNETAGIRQLIASATGSAGAHGGWLRVSRPTGKADYILFAAPIRAERLLHGISGPIMLLTILDPSTRMAPTAEALRMIFGLSNKEAEVAAHLACGRDLAVIAKDLGIAAATARAHLKAIFRKTDVSRQHDLVSLLGSIAAMSHNQASN